MTLSQADLEQMFDRARKRLQFVDLHVHTMPQICGPGLYLRGPDNLFDYHYAYGEVMSLNNMRTADADAFWAMSQDARVDQIGETLFGSEVLPLSEASMGILTAAKALGLPTESGDIKLLLREWRKMYNDMGDIAYGNHVFELSGITNVISTQSIFVKNELDVYLDDAKMAQWDPRYWCGLRFDEFMHQPKILADRCDRMGFPKAAGELEKLTTQEAARALLRFWVKRLPDVKYIAVSLPGKMDFKDDKSRIMLTLTKVLIPICKELGLPLFLMPFVRRQINSNYRNAGDIVERGDINGLIDFVAQHPDVLFCITPMHDIDNFDLAFATRALGNVRLWGHWWGNLNPVLIEKQMRLRLEMVGFAQYGVNSDARIDDQLLFKWPHYMAILKKVIVERSLQIQATGWPVTEESMMASIKKLHDWQGLFSLAL
jgi:hypothetical protein